MRKELSTYTDKILSSFAAQIQHRAPPPSERRAFDTQPLDNEADKCKGNCLTAFFFATTSIAKSISTGYLHHTKVGSATMLKHTAREPIQI
jgi:hypothetical protein